MNTTAKRLYAIAIIVLAIYGVNRLVQAAVKAPEAVFPDWTFGEMPYQLGAWQGEDTKMDPVVARGTGADIIVDRLYRNEAGVSVSIHTAMFKDPTDGMFHTPLSCYRAAGWQKLKESQENLVLSEDLTIPVLLVTWEKDGERIIVVYWYQLGEHVLFDRWAMGNLRPVLRGKSKWPALIKVMMQIPAPDVDDAKSQVLALAEHVAKWENQPQHRKYFEESPEESPKE
jgi:EpsI family protein